MSKKFGISKEQQGSNIVNIPAPVKLSSHNPLFPLGYEFPIAKIVNIAVDPAKKMKESGLEVEKPVLIIVFKDAKARQFTHMEFPINDDDEKFDSKMDWLNQRIKHIWDEVIGADKFPANGIGSDAKDFGEFYTAVAAAFNSFGIKKEGTEQVAHPYATVPLYLKLTYNGDRLNLPLFPNFIQRAKSGDKQVPCEKLLINPNRDAIEIKAKQTTYSGGTDHAFGGGTTSDDFPDV